MGKRRIADFFADSGLLGLARGSSGENQAGGGIRKNAATGRGIDGHAVTGRGIDGHPVTGGDWGGMKTFPVAESVRIPMSVTRGTILRGIFRVPAFYSVEGD